MNAQNHSFPHAFVQAVELDETIAGTGSHAVMTPRPRPAPAAASVYGAAADGPGFPVADLARALAAL